MALLFAQTAYSPARAQEAKGDPGTLRSAALLMRHGVISPKYALPKIPSEWPMGFKQLTAVGMHQMYEQGQALRRKYVDELGLISKTFKNSEVYIRASNADRALQSAQMIALGLYPLGTGADPSVYDKSLEAAPQGSLAFTAIPIHSVALKNDSVLRPWTGKAKCTKYRTYVKGLSKTKVYADQGEKYKDFLTRMASITGAGEGKSPARMLYEVNETYEPLSAMVQHGMPVPKSISDDDMQLLSDLSDWNYQYQFLGKGVGRLTGGPFVGDVISNFANVIKAKPGAARRLYIYSGHQRTIAGVEAALGLETARTEGKLFRGRVPPLGSYYTFELHEPTLGEYAVQIKFSDTETGTEQAIDVPDCGEGMCPFDKFVDLMSKVVPANWRQECGG
ncbi:MAG: histidine-type phosphatase [Alphaproteobacteria bacterium]